MRCASLAADDNTWSSRSDGRLLFYPVIGLRTDPYSLRYSVLYPSQTLILVLSQVATAQQMLEKLYDSQRQALGADHPELVATLSALGDVHAMSRRAYARDQQWFDNAQSMYVGWFVFLALLSL
jgi:hypothetical protein